MPTLGGQIVPLANILTRAHTHTHTRARALTQKLLADTKWHKYLELASCQIRTHEADASIHGLNTMSRLHINVQRTNR